MSIRSLFQWHKSPTTRSSAGGRREETRRGAVRCIKLECRAGEDRLGVIVLSMVRR